MNNLHSMIYKRKSVRKYNNSLTISQAELDEIIEFTGSLEALCSDIKVEFELVTVDKTTAKRGSHCLLIYSEKKPDYLINAGYMLEQMDLYLISKNIGVCWYGLAKPESKSRNGLDFVIMLAFGKSAPSDFRTNISQFNRKKTSEIWSGDFNESIKEDVRIAPSACNTQPWRFVSNSNQIDVLRNKRILSFIPASSLSYFNSIDIGIAICFLELSLKENGIAFERALSDIKENKKDLLPIARYIIK